MTELTKEQASANIKRFASLVEYNDNQDVFIISNANAKGKSDVSNILTKLNESFHALGSEHIDGAPGATVRSNSPELKKAGITEELFAKRGTAVC